VKFAEAIKGIVSKLEICNKQIQKKGQQEMDESLSFNVKSVLAS
jgi:hypothetical protein